METQTTGFLELLRKKNRTVLEMILGILFCGIIGQVIALAVPGEGNAKAGWCLSLLLGTVLAIAAVFHMYRTLDRALDLDEGSAQKLIYRGYLMRYLFLVAVILFLIGTKVLNPLLVFAAYMSLKVTVYLQPFTHILCNKLFHETDPEPEPMPEEAEEPETEGAKAEEIPEEKPQDGVSEGQPAADSESEQ